MAYYFFEGVHRDDQKMERSLAKLTGHIILSFYPTKLWDPIIKQLKNELWLK